MFSKVLALCATLAVVRAGNLVAGPQLAYSSAPAVSSVYQSLPAKSVAYAAPAYQTTYSAPAIHTTYSAPAIQTYAAPAYQTTYAAPAIKTYSAPAYQTTYAAPAIKTYSAPAYQTTYAAPLQQTYSAPIAKVATYSSAPAVSQVYSSIAQPSIAYAPAHIGYSSPAIGSTHQSTIRSFDGTVSHQSKAIDTAFSSVRKSDTRISNNLYTPALATKTISYAAPLATKTLAYAAPSYAATSYASPAVYSSGPAVISQKAAISYSAAPIVSHVSFEGIGANYAW
ncbi:hypothetical protein HA402_004784 [Bradysia odoriphaga]|nr:hypothetical protein HA402_004784 [Bradysia odoriphaga]